MKTFDVIAAALLVIGGLNWGLVGLLNFDLVASVFGTLPVVVTLVYALVGAAALYQVVGLIWIQKRWNVSPRLAAAG